MKKGDIRGVPSKEIELLKKLEPYQRVNWLRGNIQRVIQTYCRRTRKRLQAYCLLGFTRRQLREQGFNIRPKTLRSRAHGC